MNLPTTAELTQLNARIDRLTPEERDLRERVANVVSALENEGRWLGSDPLYQSLSSVLSGVRRDLGIAEKELLAVDFELIIAV